MTQRVSHLLWLMAHVFLLASTAGPVAASDGDQPKESPLDRAVRELPKEEEATEPPRLQDEQRGMIEGFLDSWPLFHNTYLAGWLIAATLAMVGVLVVARDQVFIGAAVSQASMLGVAAGLCLGGWSALHAWPWLHSDDFLSALAVIFSIAAALLTARSGPGRQETSEALTGWVFLFAASFSILIVSHSPHGLEEVHRLLYSSIIGSTATDVVVLALLACLTAIGIVWFGRRLLLFALDPEMAAAVGMRTRLWAVGFCLWLGLAVGLSIRASGMLYTFGCLILPALVAKHLCREVRPMFVVAPVVAVVSAATGFVLAHHYDFPPGQMTVALLCGLLVLCWALGASIRVARRRFEKRPHAPSGAA